MPSRRISSLHHNLSYQDAHTGGKNVVFHRSHRSKKGRRDHHYLQSQEYWDHLEKKMEKFDEIEEKRYKMLDY
jgi:hypothetical protein